MILFTISKLHKGTIIKRPSAHIKTPYVADVTVENIEFLESIYYFKNQNLYKILIGKNWLK